MELKELTAKVIELFKADSHKNLTACIRNAITSNNCSAVYDSYLELCPDLTVDYLQKIYQFYCADRKVKRQDYTPAVLSRLVALLTAGSGRRIYDCCAGSGSLSIQQWVINPDAHFICEELDENVMPILLFNLAIRNMNATVIQKDVLTGEVFKRYDVKRGAKYSSIAVSLFTFDDEIKADVAVGNPPFNLHVAIPESLKCDFDKMTCNFAFVERLLQCSSGKAAIILSAGVLTSLVEAPFRRRLVERGWIVAAISLPDKMFESTQVQTCVLLFDKNKTSKDIMLIDATAMGSVEVRKQRGEGDSSHYNRIYSKTFNSFTDEQLAAVCGLVRVEQDNYSKRVSLEELAERKFSFSLGMYKSVDPIPNTIHRDFNEIISDINRIIRERNVLKISINKTWAKELGLTELIESCKRSAELARSINKSMNFKNYKIDATIAEDDYIKQSNSKVFSIENTDKGQLSSIMPFFMNMWKQHIFYLNLQENALLAELRDAMLPYLMSGDLIIEHDEKV